MIKRLLLPFCVLLLFTIAFVKHQNAQQAQSPTIDQCRLTVDVVRAQLQNAQDMWAYWADQAAIARGQLGNEQKKVRDLEKKLEETANDKKAAAPTAD